MKLKPRKCEFFVKKIKYLYHVVRLDTLKVDAIARPLRKK